MSVTIEFLGPLAVAVAGSRRRLDVLWVLLVATGVALLMLGRGADGGLDPVGVALAGVAAVGWAGYIVLTKRVGSRWSGLEGLAVSLAVAAVLALGPGFATAGYRADRSRGPGSRRRARAAGPAGAVRTRDCLRSAGCPPPGSGS